MSDEMLVALANVPHPGTQVGSEARGFLAQVLKLSVSTPAEYEGCAEILSRIKGRRAAVDEQHAKLKRPILDAGRAIDDFFRGPRQVLEQAENAAKDKLLEFDRLAREAAAQEQRRLEAEAAARRRADEERAAEARRKAEADAAEIRRKAQAEAAELKRRADEEAAALRRQAQEAASAAQARQLELQAECAREAALQQAAFDLARAEEKAEAKVERAEERAQGFEQRAALTVTATVQTATPKVAGLSRRMIWRYRVKDAAAVKREFLMLDDEKISKIAKAMGRDAEALVGGIEVYEEPLLGSRKA